MRLPLWLVFLFALATPVFADEPAAPTPAVATSGETATPLSPDSCACAARKRAFMGENTRPAQSPPASPQPESEPGS